MTIKSTLSYCLVAALISLTLSCQNSKTKEDTKSSNISWIGKKIQFPKELMILDGIDLFPFEKIEKQYANTSKVISIVDATCSSCILGQLNRTDSLFQTVVDRDENIIFILNVNKNDSASFMVSLRPFIKARGRILWDADFYFESLNDVFSENIINRTFLLNSKNEIVLVGNPLFQPSLIEEYKERF